MNSTLNDLLYVVPPGTEKYAADLCDLRLEDIPWNRVPELSALLSGSDEFVAVEAATVLCSWGVDEGFEYLRSFVAKQPPLAENWHPHRLRLYDQTYERILHALVGYWALKSDRGESDHARKKVFEPVTRIIELSNAMPFEVSAIFWVVREKNFEEYLPVLKAHLRSIVPNPDLHHWKLNDCAALLMKFDPDFVRQQFALHGLDLDKYLS
jgi:hypothetical protein